MPEVPLSTSHLILHVADTDASIAFWRDGLGAELESDEALAAPALDAMFGRRGVRIRSTFLRLGGVRLHTIETLDAPRRLAAGRDRHALGLGGLSFLVADLAAAHARATRAGLAPTGIYDFPDLARPVRMFFLDDPDGVRVELMEEAPA